MAAACPDLIGKKIVGSVWTKIESKEMSGQFPASVRVEYPQFLAVEVTNLIGAPQAWLTVRDGKTELRLSTENQKEYGKGPRARDMLGGLPLELAPRLFAGGAPCPSDEKNQDVRVKRNGDELEVVAYDLRSHVSTRFIYRFERYAGRPWVQEAEWSRGTNRILITREEPSDPDGAPKRWGASSPRGEIRVRWKDRTVESASK